MAEIQFISTTRVRAACRGGEPTGRIELTPWDLQLISLGPIQKGLLFLKPTPQQPLPPNTATTNVVVDHLKSSFSRALDFFPPLAGRLGLTEHDEHTSSFFIDCNNAGADFLHAALDNVKVSDILNPTYVPRIVHSFFPLHGSLPNHEGVSKPLLAVQVTELVDGFFIGCTMNHAVADGSSFWNFFNSWSEISRKSGHIHNISRPPIFERWFPPGVGCPIRIPFSLKETVQTDSTFPLLGTCVKVKSYIEEIEKRGGSDSQHSPPSMEDQERVFHFTKAKIVALKAKANVETDSSYSLLGTCVKVKFHIGETEKRGGSDSQHSPPSMEDHQERVFHFTKAKIAALKAKANVETGSSTISSLQALLAHLWVSMVRCQPVSSDEQVRITLLISARGRMKNPSLPEGYFGNTVHPTAIVATAGELADKGVGWAALEMNKAVALQTSDQVKEFWKVWVESPKVLKLGDVMAKNALGISSSPRFDVYGNDFGWGKPVAVRSGSANKNDGKITLFPGVEEGSIDIEVCSAPERLVAMAEDKEFMEAVTI